ncbi:TPA: ead/Ea22-like family protein [Klebsiella michiganensis]|nr:ead/Ea22-like family protein [Klebsiella michiganensis]HDX8795643.1 ead/Ea22-like family protein [Klebsiella michiganensis]
MTTDITELAQSLKAAAEKATQGNWRAFKYHDGRCGIGGGHHDEIMVCEHISKRRPHDAEFIALANPANILALVEALEKAQETIAFQQGEIKALLSSLESRTVTVKLPAERFCPAEYAGSQLWLETEVWNKAITACADALRADGIKVEVE